MKVKISTYRITLSNKIGEKQILNYFNGEDDFLNLLNDYLSHIHKNVRSYTDNIGNRRTFTIEGIQRVDSDQRLIYGYFDSAYTGESINIKDSATNDLKFKVKNEDLQSRNFFFIVSVPKNSKYAYLVIQRKSNHGVKSILENSFNEFIFSKGFLDLKINLEEAPSYYLLQRMIELGRLKEIKLTKNTIFSSFDEQFNNLGIVNSGTSEQILRLNKDSRTESYKKVLFKLYNSSIEDYEQVGILSELFDEVAFTMELNDSTKTFYIKDKSKIRSNEDITKLLEFEAGEPKLNSLIDICSDIIKKLRSRNSDDGDMVVSA